MFYQWMQQLEQDRINRLVRDKTQEVIKEMEKSGGFNIPVELWTDVPMICEIHIEI